MVTNYPQQIAAEIAGRLSRVDAVPDRLLTALWKRVRHAICGLHGHDSLLHFEENRMFLRCASCGYETPGWAIEANAPQLRFCGDPRRHELRSTHPDLAETRRIA